MKFETYPKIPGPWTREMVEGNPRGVLQPNSWTSPELESLQSNRWVFTEKIDGTNIRVHWDGSGIRLGGRTDRAFLYKPLAQHLHSALDPQLLEAEFGDTPCTLFGEGFGAPIQGGGIYRPDPGFILFDVRVGFAWLPRERVEQVAQSLGIPVVPQAFRGTLWTAIRKVSDGWKSRTAIDPEWIAEGVVGVTEAGLCDRWGRRIQVKVKYCDFRDFSGPITRN